MVATPEHDKLHRVKERSQTIGEFLEWLNGKKQIKKIGRAHV